MSDENDVAVNSNDDDDNDSCTEDDPVHDFHMKTFLEMTESLDTLRKISEQDGRLNEKNFILDESLFLDDKPPATCNENTAFSVEQHDTIRVTTHASVMYYGDRLALSTETVELTMSRSDYDMFSRVVKCFTNMVMGTYTNKDIQDLRDDHECMLKRWDSINNSAETRNLSINDPRRTASDEIHKMIKNMLGTPVYYTSSCMALIACGTMLRDLFRSTLKRDARDFDDLMDFIRKHMRHNPTDPFHCECKAENACSDSYKTLLSLILEIPTIIHNQTYMLQILAYLMYDKDGREEIFVVNMKNVVSPGLLDKIPTRLALLVGSLDEKVIKSRMKQLRRLNIGALGWGNKTTAAATHGTTAKQQYNRVVLENLVSVVHDPKIGVLINALPGTENATVELVLERCRDKRICLNADNNGDINTPKYNNNGKNRCCGYLKLDPVGMLASSISLLQLCVYLYTDTRQVPSRSQRHFFVRDILVTMAKCSMNIDDNVLEDIYGYLDRCDVFKGFAYNPIFTSTFYKLFQSYLKSMKSMALRFRSKRRRINRVLENRVYGLKNGS